MVSPYSHDLLSNKNVCIFAVDNDVLVLFCVCQTQNNARTIPNSKNAKIFKIEMHMA